MRLSDRIVRQLPAPARGNKVTYEGETEGFGARVKAAGDSAFILNYGRKADGRESGLRSADSRTGPRVQHARKPSVSSAALTAVPIPSATYWRTAPRGPSPTCARGSKSSTYRQARIDSTRLPEQISVDIVPAIGRLRVAAVTFADIDGPLNAGEDGMLQPPDDSDQPRCHCVRKSGMLAALSSTCHA